MPGTIILNPVVVEDGGGSLTVDGPLTDVQLRAAAVPTTGPVATRTAGNIATVGQNVAVHLNGAQSVGFRVGINGLPANDITLAVEASIDDGLTWFSAFVNSDLGGYTSTVASVASVTPITGWFVVYPGVTNVRLIYASDTGGNADVQLITSGMHIPLAAGFDSLPGPVTVVQVGGRNSGGTLVALNVDGAGRLDVTSTTQLPAALVGGRLDENVGAWLGSTAPTVGQKTKAASLPVTLASDQGFVFVNDGGGSITVDGPLTDVQLRATAIPVSVAALTDTVTATGTIDAIGENVTLAVQGRSNVAFSISGAGLSAIGVVQFFESIDGGASWLLTEYFIRDVGVISSRGTALLPDTPPYNGHLLTTGGATHVKVEVATYTAGSIDVRITASNGSTSLPLASECAPGLDSVRTAVAIGSVDVNGVLQAPQLQQVGTDEYALGTNLRRSGVAASEELLGQTTMAKSLPVTFATDQSAIKVVGNAASGSAPSGNPVLTAGFDGTNVQPLRTDSSGRQVVIGQSASDAPVVGNPVLVAGRASAAAPAAVDADGDAVTEWRLRNGAAATVLTAAGALIGGDAANGLDVDVTRVPAPLNVVGGGVEATALRVTIASDSTGVLSVDDNGGSITVDGTLTPERATAGAPVGVIVSTSAVLALASNAAAKSRIITNNSTSNIYLGRTNAVTASGVTMGILLKANGGSYNDSGVDLYNGDIYAIGDAVSATQNLSVWERT